VLGPANASCFLPRHPPSHDSRHIVLSLPICAFLRPHRSSARLQVQRGRLERPGQEPLPDQWQRRTMCDASFSPYRIAQTAGRRLVLGLRTPASVQGKLQIRATSGGAFLRGNEAGRERATRPAVRTAVTSAAAPGSKTWLIVAQVVCLANARAMNCWTMFLRLRRRGRQLALDQAHLCYL